MAKVENEGKDNVGDAIQVYRNEVVLPDGSREITADLYVSVDIVDLIGEGDRVRGLARLIARQTPKRKSPFEDLDLPQDPEVVN